MKIRIVVPGNTIQAEAKKVSFADGTITLFHTKSFDVSNHDASKVVYGDTVETPSEGITYRINRVISFDVKE